MRTHQLSKSVLMVLAGSVVVLVAYFAGLMQARTTIKKPDAGWAEQDSVAGAWQEMIISLEAAGAAVYASTDDPRARHDGFMHLADLFSTALEMKLSKGDPARPAFTDWMRDHRKLLGDLDDAIYMTAEISAAHDYEITGKRNDAGYLGFVVYGRGLNGWNKVNASLSSATMRFDADGRFRLVLSRTAPDDPDTNWLPLTPDAHMVMVRQYFHDRPASRSADIAIHNRNPLDYQMPSREEIAGGLHAATTFFNEAHRGTLALADMLATAPNSVDPPRNYDPDFVGIFYPTPDNGYFGTQFNIQPDEALIVEGEVPDAPYWSVSLQDRWMRSLDYTAHQTSLNNHEIKTRNGRYRVVIAHKNPELKTGWRRSGTQPDCWPSAISFIRVTSRRQSVW